MRLVGRLIQNNLFGRLRSLTVVGILILILLAAEKRLRAKEPVAAQSFGNGNLFCPSHVGLEYCEFFSAPIQGRRYKVLAYKAVSYTHLTLPTKA